ncbi:MAG: hypothetical protein CMJ75_12965 [Planctomycetaceae bacterium]|nr:hypothetical protein [Planctomycetaceae bacterium]
MTDLHNVSTEAVNPVCERQSLRALAFFLVPLRSAFETAIVLSWAEVLGGCLVQSAAAMAGSDRL